MKKIFTYFALCFAFVSVCNFAFVNNKTAAAAEETETIITSISSCTDFVNEIGQNPDGHFVLESDLDFASTSFYPLANFSGVLDGNGMEISNITILRKTTENNFNYGIFEQTNGAIIKNIKLNNINASFCFTEDTYVANIGLIAGKAVNTIFENIAFTNANLEFDDSEFLAGSTTDDTSSGVDDDTTSADTKKYNASSTNAGLIAGTLESGSYVRNINLYEDVLNETQNNLKLNNFKGFEDKVLAAGTLFGRVKSSQIYNVCIASNLEDLCTFEKSFIGGLVGIISGNETEIFNIVSQINYADASIIGTNFGSAFGSIKIDHNMPNDNSIAYIYTSLSNSAVGNITELDYNSTIGAIDFDLKNCKFIVLEDDNNFLKEFFVNVDKDENWDNFKSTIEWDFNQIWQANERGLLPKLQFFEYYEFDVDFDVVEGVNTDLVQEDGLSVIEGLEFGNSGNFKYGDTFFVAARVTENQMFSKLVEISGIKTPNGKVFLNSDLFDIINNPEAVIYDCIANQDATDETVSAHLSYTIRDKKVDVLTDTALFDEVLNFEYNTQDVFGFALESETLYLLNGSNIVLVRGKTNKNDTVCAYFVLDSDNNASGKYSFVLSGIEHRVVIKTEDENFGFVRSGDAAVTVKETYIERNISFGETLYYVASTSEGYEFCGWFIDDVGDKTSPITLNDVNKTFDEKLFAAGGLFATAADVNNLVLVAGFTKDVIDLTFKFSIDGKVDDKFDAKIFIDKNFENNFVYDNEVAKTDSVLSDTVAKGSSFAFEIIVPTGYTFVEWNVIGSDGNVILNLGSENISDVISNFYDEEYTIVAYLKAVEADTGNLLVILLSIGGGLLVIGAVVAIVIYRKKGGSRNSYKRGYY